MKTYFGAWLWRGRCRIRLLHVRLLKISSSAFSKRPCNINGKGMSTSHGASMIFSLTSAGWRRMSQPILRAFANCSPKVTRSPGPLTHQARGWEESFSWGTGRTFGAPLSLQQCKKALVSYSNPQGTITNLDLELVGTITHHDVVCHTTDARERFVYVLSDNTPAVAWQQKGSTTTTHAPAYLLRIQALHQRFHHYYSRHDYIPGPCNVMADDASRLWDHTDTALLSHFNSLYPQNHLWQLLHPRSEMLSAVTCALWRKRCKPGSFLAVPPRPPKIGGIGKPFAPSTITTHGSETSKTPSFLYKSTPNDSVTAGPPPAIVPSNLKWWMTSCVKYSRRSPWWGPPTLV